MSCYVPEETQLIVLCKILQGAKLLKQKSSLRKRFLMSRVLSGLALTKVSSLQAYLLSHPFLCIFSAYIFAINWLGYFTFVLERRFAVIHGMPVLSIAQVQWMMVITITSVGYGDTTPKSPAGKLVMSVISISGVLLAGIFISVTQKFLEVPENEKKIFETINRQKLVKSREIAAVRLIQTSWRYYSCKRNLLDLGMIRRTSKMIKKTKKLLSFGSIGGAFDEKMTEKSNGSRYSNGIPFDSVNVLDEQKVPDGTTKRRKSVFYDVAQLKGDFQKNIFFLYFTNIYHIF